MPEQWWLLWLIGGRSTRPQSFLLRAGDRCGGADGGSEEDCGEVSDCLMGQRVNGRPNSPISVLVENKVGH